MLKIRLAGLALLFTIAAGLPGAEPSTAPKIDRPKWENFLRYAEGYLPAVKFEFEDPKPTFIPGFYQVTVHLSNGEGKLDRQYYVTADGQSIVSGTLWNVNQGPFAENLKLLPKTGFSFGPPDATVNIVVFSDFQCPYCSQLAKTIRDDLPKKYGDRVRVIFADFPLAAIHPWARAAAEGANCLGDQKPAAFWAFHDWVFEHQKEVTADNLREKTIELAKQQSLDAAKLAACLDTHAPAAQIDKSIQLGRLLQVQQTPTFFVNGREETGALPWERLSALIDFEFSRPKEFASTATTTTAEKCCEVTIPKVGGK
jgi:protein-disulfide isomerase